MDLLAAVTGSRVRADVLAALFAAQPRSWDLSSLGRAARRPHQLVDRELERLIDAGLVRVRKSDRKRRFEPDLEAPASRELARFVRQARGRIPRTRHALVTLRSRALAWAAPGSLLDPRKDGPAARRMGLIVLTSAPKSLVRVQLADIVGSDTELHCMSVSEWVARLDKGDVLLRRLRRSRKLWVLGSWDELLGRERAEIDAKRLLRSAVANWREELSDEWDEDWDPFAPVPGA